MPKPSLSDCSIQELQELILEAQTLMVEKQKEKKRVLIQRFRDMSREAGLSLEEVLNMPPKGGKKKSTGVPKYQNPDNPAETWTGKGRKPSWLVAKIEEGNELEEFAILGVKND